MANFESNDMVVIYTSGHPQLAEFHGEIARVRAVYGALAIGVEFKNGNLAVFSEQQLIKLSKYQFMNERTDLEEFWVWLGANLPDKKQLILDRIPNAGSDAAIDAGCICPVMDNNHGRGITEGYGGTPDNPVFWITENCPIHTGSK